MEGYPFPLTRCRASSGRPTPPDTAPQYRFYVLSAPSSRQSLRRPAASNWGCCLWWTSNMRSDSGPLCSYFPAFHSSLTLRFPRHYGGHSEHHCSSAATSAQRSRCAVIQRPGRLRFSSFWLVRLRGRWGRDADLRLAAILLLQTPPPLCHLNLCAKRACKHWSLAHSWITSYPGATVRRYTVSFRQPSNTKTFNSSQIRRVWTKSFVHTFYLHVNIQQVYKSQY